MQRNTAKANSVYPKKKEADTIVLFSARLWVLRKLRLYQLQAQFLHFWRESVGVKAIRRKQRFGEESLEMVFVKDASEPLDSGHKN